MVTCFAMIHIEFSGIPGSGKTYLCSLLAERLRVQGIKVVTSPVGLSKRHFLIRVLYKAGPVVAQIIQHPVWTTQVIYTIVASRQSSIKSFLRSFFTIIQVTGTIRKHKKKDICLLLDQGSVQALFSLLYDAKNIPVRDSERILPIPDILLETDSPDPVLLNRLESRTRPESRAELEGAAGLQHSRKLFSVIRNTPFFQKITETIIVPDERTDSVVLVITQQIQKRIHDDTQP